MNSPAPAKSTTTSPSTQSSAQRRDPHQPDMTEISSPSVPTNNNSNNTPPSGKNQLPGMSLNGPGNRSTPRSACEPCRNRKIKCTGERPTCARCAKMGKACEYQSAANSWTYIAALEQRVKNLEAEKEKLTAAQKHGASTPGSSGSSRHSRPSSDSPRLSAKRARHTYGDKKRNRSDSPQKPSQLALLGTGKLPSTTQLLERMPTGFDLIGMISRQDSRNERALSVVSVDRAILPAPRLVHELLSHFSTYTGGAFPIFHTPTLLKQVEEVCFKDGQATKTDICVVMLVLAVSATSLPRSSPLYHDLKPRALDFWNYAQHHLPAALDNHGLARLQILLIHLQYVLYNPHAGSVWDLSGAAIRAAVDLGLHHENGFRDSRSCLEHDMRRRLFWVSYAVDRSMCTALGRPPGIPDDWINADFPSIVDDALILPEGILPGEPSPMKATALHNFRIRILQSEVHHRLYVASSTTQQPPPQEWYDSVVGRLRQWRSTLPAGTGFCSEEWLNLLFHLTMIMLFRPSPGNSAPGREGLTKALMSSGAVMKTYKDMYRMGRINFNWLAIYQLFIAGVTYLNSLWQAHRSGWSIVPSYVDAILEVQVCSSVMEALAAITPGTSNIRNAFEAVSERIIRHLTSRAEWSASVPPSPPLSSTLAPEQPTTLTPPTTSYALSNDTTVEPWQLDDGLGNTSLFEGLTSANPFDGFLLHPLGDMSADDWERAVGNALQPLS